MTDLRQRLFLAFQRVNLALRRIGFQLYLNRRKAHLDGADLSYLNLGGVNLTGARLAGANLTSRQLATAKSLAGATLPDGSMHE